MTAPADSGSSSGSARSSWPDQPRDRSTDRLLARPGDTCWRVARADRLAFLVDGEAYFRAARDAMIQARVRIQIAAWDISSTTPLLDPDAAPPGDGWPVRLADLLRALTAARPELDVSILLWDFPLMYASDRELMPAWRQDWNPHPRMRLRLDGSGPIEAAQHEKLIVIDDQLAFMGGLDPAPARWDTPAHRLDDARRRLPTSGAPYPPFHDMQTVMSGPVAGVLGQALAQRWRAVTGDSGPGDPPPGLPVPWPAGITPDIKSVPVALARTRPATHGQVAVKEICRLIEADIAAARDWIYLEDQYLTARVVADALARRLAEPDGPEVVAVIPRIWDGWLETATMGVGRERLLRALRKADVHGRLRVVTPVLEGRGPGWLKIHTKLMIVDRRALRHGSANLNNRSMGLDSELDLHLEPDLPDPDSGEPAGAPVAMAIERLLCTLVGEHLGTDPDTIRATLRETNSLRAVLDRHGDPATRDLEPVPDGDTPANLVEAMPDPVPGDFEAPVSADSLRDVFLPDGAGGAAPVEPRQRPVLRAVLLGAAVVAMLAAWRLTPLGDAVDRTAVTAWIQAVRAHPLAPLGAIATLALGSLVMAPITVLIVVMALVFGPVPGFLYSTVGALLSAAIGFGLGRTLGRGGLDRLLAHSRHAHRAVEALRRHGLKTVLFFRIVPVLQYTLVNLACGAAGVSARTFALGTVLGMVPGIAIMSLFGEGLGRMLRAASLGEALGLTLGLLGLVGGFALASRWLARRRAPAEVREEIARDTPPRRARDR